MLFMILVSIIVLYVCSVSTYHIVNRRGRLKAKIPGPKYWPVIGNSIYFVTTPEKIFLYMRTLHKTYGDIVKVGAMDIFAVLIYNPHDIEVRTCRQKYIEKEVPYTFLKGWLGEGLLTSNGNKWHARRKMLTPAFHFNILRRFFHTFTDETELLLQNIGAEVGKERSDLVQLINNMTLRTVCKTAMGTAMNESTESVVTKYLNAIHILGNTLILRISRVWLFFDISYQFSRWAKIERKTLKDLHAFTRNVIQDRKLYIQNNPGIMNAENDDVNKKGRLAMLDLLLRSQKEGLIDDEGIREEVDTFMFRGHDTTAMALVFFIMRLANEPEIQNKIYEEMTSIYGQSDRVATMDDLKEMKYLECCIKESLRIYPSVHYIARQMTEDIELAGYKLTANSTVQIPIYDLHHRPDLYPEPERFVPERFLPENCLGRHPYAYIPFSAGPRNCIGQKFAMLEMKTLMSGMLRKYRLEPVTKHTDIVFTADVVLRAKHPIYVRFCSRK